MVSKILMAASAGIFFLLGAVHFAYTFSGSKLTPRDPALQVSMSDVSPVISKETTMWSTWIGFNASHGMGLMLFGLIYGYLAFFHPDLLFKSPFLLVIGFLMIGGMAVIAKLYFFSVPFWSVCVALVCYLTSIAFSRT